MSPARRVSCLLTATIAMATGANAAVTLTGVYDPASTNDVDQSGTFLSGTGGITSANVINVSTFKPLVATAFAAGKGGVASFDTVGDSVSTTGFTTSGFGAGGNNTLTFNVVGDLSLSTPGTASNGRVTTSGLGWLGKGTGDSDFNFSSFTLNGPGTSGAGVTHFGATLIHRQAAQSWSVSATFSGGGTLTFNNLAFAVADTANTKDTFFGIAAPSNQFITSVFFDGNGFTNMEDVAVITNIPEPSSSAMVALLGVGLLLRRRRM